MFGSRHVHRCAAVVAAGVGVLAFSAGPAEAGVAITIGGSGRVRPGERLVYRVDFRHAYDPRPSNGIAPGDHVSITLSPPACEAVCVARRLSRGLSVPRRGRMRFRFRFPREYTVCARVVSGTGSACRRVRWQPGDRGILGVTAHGFSRRCPFGACRRSGAKSLVVAAFYPGNVTGSEGASRFAIRWKITWLTFSPVRLPPIPTVDTTAIVSRLPGR
jgi:hypothetical protein